jgi:hypothetical protein
MSGIVYPSGLQTLRIPTTILLPSTTTPFNPSAVNPSVEACWDAVKALENYGLYRATFDAAQPPYPAGGSFVNVGTYKFGTTSQTKLEFSSAKTYLRAAHPHAWFNPAVWFPSFNAVPPKPYYRQDVANASASSDALVVFFDLPGACTLETLSLWIDPANTHAAVPGTIPHVEVYLGNITTGAATLIVSASGYNGTGTYADLAQYQAPHKIIADLSSTVFDAGVNTLFAKVYGEDGPDERVDGLYYLPWIEYTRTRLGEEFGELAP